LWSSNGTRAGTGIVQDINPGPAGSAPSQLTVVGHTLFMTATDLSHNTELWAYRPGAAPHATIPPSTPANDDATAEAFRSMCATTPPDSSSMNVGWLTSRRADDLDDATQDYVGGRSKTRPIPAIFVTGVRPRLGDFWPDADVA
jgi:hypothetical protein